MKVSISNSLTYLMFVIIMFCAIFTPDFFSFSIRYLLVLFCGGYLACNLLLTKRTKIKSDDFDIIKGFIPFISFFILSQSMWALFDTFNSEMHISVLIHTLITFIGAFVISSFMICICRKLDLKYTDFVNIVLIVMIIQLICVILALTVPSVRQYFNSLIIKNSYSERLAELAEASNRGFADRSYGLSNNLFDSFGYITSVLILLLYNKGMEEKNNKLIFISLIMIIMPLVNARTGVLLLLLGFFVVNLFYFDVRSVFKIFVIILIGLIAFSQVIRFLPPEMNEWLSSGMQDIFSLLSGSKDEGVFSEILGADLVLPSNILLGAGGPPSSFHYRGIDNGYINCIWNFGLIGTILLFMGYNHLFKKVYYKNNLRYCKSISSFFAVVYFVYMIKIYPIDNFGINVIMFGVPSVLLSNSENELI